MHPAAQPQCLLWAREARPPARQLPGVPRGTQPLQGAPANPTACALAGRLVRFLLEYALVVMPSVALCMSIAPVEPAFTLGLLLWGSYLAKRALRRSKAAQVGATLPGGRRCCQGGLRCRGKAQE